MRPNRRGFLERMVGATAGMFIGGHGLSDAAFLPQIGAPPGKRPMGQYPFDWPVGVDFILNASFLSDADKEAVLGGNAIKLLRIHK